MRRPPQAVAAIPPLPNEVGERAINVIQLESKGKEKVEEPELTPGKKATIPEVMEVKKNKTRVTEEMSSPPASMETEEDATTSKKRKKRSSTRRKITIKDFPLGSKEDPYDLVEDVSNQGPKLTWP